MAERRSGSSNNRRSTSKGRSGGPPKRSRASGGRGGDDRSRGRSSAGRSRAGKGGGSGRGADSDRGSRRRDREHGGRAGNKGQARDGQRRAFSVDGGPSNLPRWLKEEIQRVTPRERQDATIVLLSEAAADFADEQFGSAHRKLLKAKDMSSRASAIRELLGLTAYRLGKWDQAVRELRAFRRFTGDTTHMPVEMDALRGLERDRDVEKTWELFMELGGHPATDSEARVVYGSFLLDEGRLKDAWAVTRPKRVTKDGRPHELRRWFIAARAALALGDTATATTLLEAVRSGDPEMPGLDQLSEDIAAATP